MLRDSLLNRNIKRTVKIEGAWEFDPNRQCVVFKNVVVEGKDEVLTTNVVPAHTDVVLTSLSTLELTERVVHVQPHPLLENSGIIGGQRLYDESDGKTTIKFSFCPDADFDLGALPWFCKIYVSGDNT